MADRLIFEDDTKVIRDVSETYPLPVNVIEGGSDAYDSLTDSDKTTVLNPDSNKEGPLLQEDFVNLAATYTRYITVNGKGQGIIHFDKTGGVDVTTLRIFGIAENNGTVDSSASFIDITNGLRNLATNTYAATYTTDCALEINYKGWRFIKVEITISGGANDADGSVFINYAY